MIVIDASAALELILHTELGERVFHALGSPAPVLHAPHLIDLEVIQGLRRMTAQGKVTVEQAGRALQDFADLDLARYPHEPMLMRIWSLRDNFTAYDAAYIALCEALEGELLTFDRRLARAPGLPIACRVP